MNIITYATYHSMSYLTIPDWMTMENLGINNENQRQDLEQK